MKFSIVSLSYNSADFVVGNGLEFARKATIMDSEYDLSSSERNGYYFNVPRCLLMAFSVNNGRLYRLQITR